MNSDERNKLDTIVNTKFINILIFLRIFVIFTIGLNKLQLK